MWNLELNITAKYRFFDKNNPYTAKLCSCSCPIIENLKLPIEKQEKEYGLYRFCNMQKNCLCSVNFETEIDVRKDFYSQ